MVWCCLCCLLVCVMCLRAMYCEMLYGVCVECLFWVRLLIWLCDVFVLCVVPLYGLFCGVLYLWV